MRFTLSFLLVLAVGCGGSNKGGTGGNGGAGGGGSSSGTDMSAGGSAGGSGSSSDGGAGADMRMPSCDVAGQTGCPTGDKCVPGGKGGGSCVANGTIGEGQACTVDQTTFQDNCLSGFICDDTVASNPVCRKICATDATCTTAGQACAGYTSKYGVCLPTCTPGGTDCATGTDCSTAVDDVSSTSTTENGFFVCKTTGAGAAFTACQGDSDCAAGLECDSVAKNVYWCVPNCNSTTACPAAPGTDMGAVTLTCQVFANQANGAGYCSGN